jgi:hypothetical protein
MSAAVTILERINELYSHLLYICVKLQASNGFLEGVVRGYKNSLLSQTVYNNLTQCENLEGTSGCPIAFTFSIQQLYAFDIRFQASAISNRLRKLLGE